MTNWISSKFGYHFLIKLMWLWPPYLGAGIRIIDLSDDLMSLRIGMKLRFWNKNAIGTQFGGSLYSMVDPFYMLMLQHHLGRDFKVLDHSASIRYIKLAKGAVWTEFKISDQDIEELKNMTEPKKLKEYRIQIKCDDEVVAEVVKVIHIKKRTSCAND